jgi:hypothetical protein
MQRFKSYNPASGKGPAWLLSLNGSWLKCEVQYNRGPLWIFNAVDGIVGGMSGSPIITDGGSAIGGVCTSGGSPGKLHTEGGPNPTLTQSLPGWCTRNGRL